MFSNAASSSESSPDSVTGVVRKSGILSTEFPHVRWAGVAVVGGGAAAWDPGTRQREVGARSDKGLVLVAKYGDLDGPMLI